MLLKKIILLKIILLFSSIVFADPHSYDHRDTMNYFASPNSFIKIQNIKIHINIKKEFASANYRIIYTFNSEKSGQQIPLLFCINISDNVTIKVNNKSYKYSNFNIYSSFPDTSIFNPQKKN